MAQGASQVQLKLLKSLQNKILRGTEVLDVHVLELLRIVALLGDALLAEAALLVDLAVSPERLVGVGANL